MNQHINGFGAGTEYFGLGRALHQGRGPLMNAAPREPSQERPVVDGIAKHIEHPARNFFTYGYFKLFYGGGDLHSAAESLGGVQGLSHARGAHRAGSALR